MHNPPVWQGFLERALAVEDSLQYMEPPQLYQPVRHCLGYVMLLNGDPAAAEKVRCQQHSTSDIVLFHTLSVSHRDVGTMPACLFSSTTLDRSLQLKGSVLAKLSVKNA